MAKQRYFMFDGQKSTTIKDSWDFVDAMAQMPQGEAGELYARVAAARTAVIKSAQAAASIPFVLLKGKTDFDTSGDWQNKVGFLPRPKDLIRRLRQSLIMNNTGYLRMGKN